MPNPQDPNVARSRKVGALNPDAIESELEAHDRPGDEESEVGTVPPANQPEWMKREDGEATGDADPDSDQPTSEPEQHDHRA